MGIYQFVASAGEKLGTAIEGAQKIAAAVQQAHQAVQQSASPSGSPFAPASGALPPNPFGPATTPPNPFAAVPAPPPQNPFGPAAAAPANPFAASAAPAGDIGPQLAAKVQALGISISGLNVTFANGTATIRGQAPSQADREKAILAVGNTEGVAAVDDQMTVARAEPPAVFHTVQSGDTLSKIAQKHYGNPQSYNAIFEANRPMLSHPDKIYPGQVLRIPAQGGSPAAAEPVRHTVKAGETLGVIAKQHYGDAKHYMRIFEANRNVLSDPNRIAVGQILVIPK